MRGVRLAGAALTLSFLVPVDTAHDGPRFVWQLAADLRPACAWALLAPQVCGAVLLAATFACRRAVSLAFVTLAAIAGLFLVTAAGAEALAWDLLPQPDTWRCGPAPGLMAVALTAVAVCQVPGGARRTLLALAIPFAAAHLVVARANEPLLPMTARALAHVAASSGASNLVGAGVLALIVLWPGLSPVVGWLHGRRPAVRSPSAALAAMGLPATLLPVVERSLADPWGGSASTAAAIGSVAVLAAILMALADAIACLASHPSLPDRPARRTGIACVAAAALVGLYTARAARPADPGVSFVLGPPTPDGDRLFGALLARWNDARASVDLHGAGGEDVAAAEHALVSAARASGGEVDRAIEALVSGAAGPDRMERRWYARVERVNDAVRRAGLPYYVDPTGAVAESDDPSARWFRVDTYRIEAVRRFTSGGRDLATLHVRSLSPGRPGYASLGLSRDVQPFAVVALDEIGAYADELLELAAKTPPRCGSADPDTVPLRACGEILARLAAEGDLRAALVDLTDRHELQHRLDAPLLPRSAWLERRLAFRPPEARDRIARELSAYLAQTTAPGPAPRLSLVRLLRMALVVRRGVEHETALLALAALGLRDDGILEAGDEDLRARGERAWAEVFGHGLARVTARE